ncbi:MAG: UDP-N-acetylglucosamine 3-dehydrogenase [Moorella sp. (in: firmicutes)]|nr:UDP-N-acetylglucosamine 3-dehydrogenase [Moorella sp. (in: firmicutes)]
MLSRPRPLPTPPWCRKPPAGVRISSAKPPWPAPWTRPGPPWPPAGRRRSALSLYTSTPLCHPCAGPENSWPTAAWARSGWCGSPGAWRRGLQASGGVILDLLAQDIAFLIGCCGRVERVYAASTANRELLDGEYALVSLRLQNGIIAHLDGNWLPGDQGGDELEIAASNGLIAYSEENTAPLRLTLGAGPGKRILASPVDEDMYAAGLRAALRALEDGDAAPPAGVEVALHTLEVALAALESAATGRVFTIA